jgi:hypothetical protein
MEGRCTCGAVTYRLHDKPMFVNCCHCTWCQRETGTAFALNAVIETDRLEVSGPVEYVMTPSASGQGQEIVRCSNCRVAIFSHYSGTKRLSAFVRVGTLDDPGQCPPGAHIFTSTRLPWVLLDPGTPAFEEYYDMSALWPAEALARRAAMKERAAARPQDPYQMC